MAKEVDTLINERMISFMDYCVQNKIKGIQGNTDWCEKINFHPTNLDGIKKGTRSFSKEHIYAAAQLLGADINYFFGFSNEILRTSKKMKPLQLLKQAVKALELELQTKK